MSNKTVRMKRLAKKRRQSPNPVVLPIVLEEEIVAKKPLPETKPKKSKKNETSKPKKKKWPKNTEQSK